MKWRHIGIIIIVTVIMSLIITVSIIAKKLQNANETIYELEHKPNTTTTTIPTTTTPPNLKPSPMSFTTNNWVFDNSAAACSATIPITVNIPIKDKSLCIAPKPT
jgi:hypothetical protein